MPQGVLPFKYEQEKTSNGLTALAGLLLYLDLVKVAGLSKSIERHLQIRAFSHGYETIACPLLTSYGFQVIPAVRSANFFE